MNICIFEDFFISNLKPLNHLRHTSEIICGAVSLKQKIESYFKPKKLTLYSRNYLVPYLAGKFRSLSVNKHPKPNCIFLNARVIYSRELAKNILKQKKSVLLHKDNVIIAIITDENNSSSINKVFDTKPAELADFANIDFEKIEISGDVRIINYPSDLILFAKEELKNDLKNALKAKKKLTIGPKCKISKQAAFNTSEGPIYIGKNTEIEPFSYIKGPVYIGDNCIVKSGTSVYGPVSIGRSCKISGEITYSVLHDFVNKQHLGFLGHSYLCEWVNLGAGTNTSNLKNNYSQIRLNIDGRQINTNSIFLGSIIGDHTKTGINTMLNTGSVIGLSCNVYGSGYHKNVIKSFTWDNAQTGQNIPYQYDKAVQTARVSMKRRKIEMSDEYEKMFRFVYDSCHSERSEESH